MEGTLLKDLFGEFVNPKTRWTTEFIDVAQRSKFLKDPTISTAGIDTGKTGSHCDIMVFDDLITPETVNTSEQMAKITSSYRDCLPLLDPGGVIVIVGTRYAMGDLYQHIIENESRTINGNVLENVDDRKNWRQYVQR